MEYLLLVPLLLGIVIIILILRLKSKQKVLDKVIFEKHDLEVLRKDELKNYFEEEWKKESNELDNRIRLKREEVKSESIKLNSDFEISKAQINGVLDKLNAQLKEKEKRYIEVNQDLDLYREGKMKEIDGTAAEYKEHQQTIIKNELEKYREDWTNKFNEDLAKLSEVREEKLNELEKINAELEVERSKRAAINEEIRRQKEVEMEKDFYRIQFSEEDKNDVEILRSVAPRLRHPEAINKVIWSAYYQKPLAELRKRLLPNGDVSCVYKATRLKTGEIYIGQTTSFDKRLQEHTRSALGIGSLASSQLHRKMLEDGPENYLWQILEVVPKDKLRERESYYIDFYDSKTYGLNSVTGDKNK